MCLVLTVRWSEVRAYRVLKNHLSARARKRDLAKVVSDMCGVQAQLLPAAELALWARVESIQQGDLQESLFKNRTLFRTWSMRGTLHILPSAQFENYVGALRTRAGYRKGAWLKYFGVSLEQIDRVIGSIGKALTNGPLTRKELAERISRSEGKHVREKLLSGWGELLKPAAYNGLLACGPDRDGEATFVRADKWLGAEPNPDSGESMKNVLRQYLGSYGPANHEDFARWWGTEPAPAKRLFKSIETELVQVDVEGYNAWITRKDRAGLEDVSQTGQVRLLPNFDSYVLGFRPRESFVPSDMASLVFRPQAWISPVLLVDGRIAGVWERRSRKGLNELRINLFGRLSKNQREELRDEIDRMSAYFQSDLGVSFSRDHRSRLLLADESTRSQ